MEKQIPIFNTLKEISDWFGLPSTELISNDFMLTEINQWNKNKLLNSPDNYKANFFTIFIINEGSATHLYNDEVIQLESSGIFITGPGHYRNYKFDHLTEAYFICFTENFLANYCFYDIYKEFPFLLSESFIYTKADPENYLIIKNNTDQIKQEIERSQDQKMILIGNMLEFLLIKITELFQNQLHPFTENNNSIVNTFYKDLGNYFNEIVERKKPEQLKAKDFADLQFLNEDYFSRIIKTKTGRTPTAWINSRLLVEVKMLLTETSMPIAEIADIFQFTNSRYFNFYFKSQTTLTPTYYRKSLHKS
ncbi:helix-turn-helix transcriptional regulator [Flavobacterium sp. ANB]|uniref:AraC family transcriptional regulator n=1 Tax=unclassified Flavobacterium TaxID=196869 RepID=UPI0012B8C614|nr:MULTISPECIES: AraC family transcriptional regulator [unclassified Flavobacterium]MBF4519465.1 helix-turn-helix transcriptional regulator [Flavobacterium sp. ANB]MTD72543.1 helix-turn-helix domain-containing protein [Flavobacterium sp. LC2016-13]